MTRNLFLASSAALTLAGCTVGPDYRPPVGIAPVSTERGAFLRASAADAAEPAAAYWTALNDPMLDSLVAQALADAPSIEAAAARVRQARAGLGEARTGALPTASASGTAISARLPDGGPIQSGTLYNLGADASWEIDLWGARRRGTEQASANVGAAEARLADAQVSLSAEIARAYVSLRANEAAESLLQRQVEIDRQLVTVAEQKYRGGTAPMQGLENARASLAASEGKIASHEAERQVLLDTLAMLVGSEPGTLDGRLGTGNIPLPPAQVQIGDPAGLLRRRPDVQVAERQLAASTAQVGIDVARQFPSISFMGLIGIGGSDPAQALDPNNLTALALPRINWSFLDFGRNKARIKGSEAARDAAEADYEAQVLAALQDAETSLTRFGARRNELAQAASSALYAGNVFSLQGQRASAGTIARAEALQSERQKIDAELGRIQATGALTLSYVDLAKALGLGWQAR